MSNILQAVPWHNFMLFEKYPSLVVTEPETWEFSLMLPSSYTGKDNDKTLLCAT